MDLKFENVSISGGVGVGTTTLMNNLKKYLEPEGWTFRSTGQIVREYTKEKVLPLASLVSDDFDREIEARARKELETGKNLVLDAWLAGFISRDLKNTLRVLLVCSSEAIRIDRIVNRDKVSVEEAKINIRKREEENFKKWKRIYGDYDFFNPEYYHLVIDTYSTGPLETVGKVLDKLGYKHDIK